jgi:hypothetical protein
LTSFKSMGSLQRNVQDIDSGYRAGSERIVSSKDVKTKRWSLTHGTSVRIIKDEVHQRAKQTARDHQAKSNFFSDPNARITKKTPCYAAKPREEKNIRNSEDQDSSQPTRKPSTRVNIGRVKNSPVLINLRLPALL